MASKKELLARTLDATGLGALWRVLRPWRGLLVLNYHRIGDASQTPFDPGVFSATPDEFEQQLGWLKKNADVVRLSELDEVFRSPRRRSVLITFDDGYRDNHQLALPILQRHGLAATFFITTGFIDHRTIAWWDEIAWIVKSATRFALPRRPEFAGVHLGLWETGVSDPVIREVLRVYKSLPVDDAATLLDDLAESTRSGRCPAGQSESLWMDWPMVEGLAAAGHAIGAHTATHPLLARCSEERQWEELAGAKKRLECRVGVPVDGFSYPVGIPGSFTDATSRLVREAGYRWAFSFQGGFVNSSRSRPDVYRLPRVAMETGLSQPRFRTLHTLPSLFA